MGWHMSHGSHQSHSNHANHVNHTSHVSTAPLYDNGIGHTSTGAHLNHFNPTSTGLPQTLAWNNWADSTLPEIAISDGIDKMTELRDKIELLEDSKGPHTTYEPVSPYFTANNPDVDTTGAADTTFEEGDKIDDNQYDALRDSIEALSVYYDGTSTNLPVKNANDFVNREDFTNLKIKIDEVAETDYSSTHVNHNNHANHSNHANHVNHTSHVSTAPLYNNGIGHTSTT